ncbi:unnamed protein product, partial [Chrysoparadoxa australica]
MSAVDLLCGLSEEWGLSEEQCYTSLRRAWDGLMRPSQNDGERECELVLSELCYQLRKKRLYDKAVELEEAAQRASQVASPAALLLVLHLSLHKPDCQSLPFLPSLFQRIPANPSPLEASEILVPKDCSIRGESAAADESGSCRSGSMWFPLSAFNGDALFKAFQGKPGEFVLPEMTPENRGGEASIRGKSDLFGALHRSSLSKDSEAYLGLAVSLSMPALGQEAPDLVGAAQETDRAVAEGGARVPYSEGLAHGHEQWGEGSELLALARARHRSCQDRTDEKKAAGDEDEDELRPIGWELIERKFPDSVVPASLDHCHPLITQARGESFDACLASCLGIPPPSLAPQQLLSQCMSAVVGSPSRAFVYDPFERTMHVVNGLHITGLSPLALRSQLTEYAVAGTAFRRLEAFASQFGTCTGAGRGGQVLHAFCLCLEQQLTVIRLEVLGLQEAPAAGSLLQLSAATASLRELLSSLQSLCQLHLQHEEEPGLGGYDTFPRGAALLNYLYREVKEQSAAQPFGSHSRVLRVCLDLFAAALQPYLAMLIRWVFTGHLTLDHDPYGEFARASTMRFLPSYDDIKSAASQAASSSLFDDGGAAFFEEAFEAWPDAATPSFIDVSTMQRVTRAGQVLQLLHMCPPEFYQSCAVSPPPSLGLALKPGQLKDRVALTNRLADTQAASVAMLATEMRAKRLEEELRASQLREMHAHAAAAARSELQERERERVTAREEALKLRQKWVAEMSHDRAVATAAAAAREDQARTKLAVEVQRDEEALAAAAKTAEGLLMEKYALLQANAEARERRAQWRQRRRKNAPAAKARLKRVRELEERAWELTLRIEA